MNKSIFASMTALLLLCAGNASSEEPSRIEVDFGQVTKHWDVNRKGRFAGPLPSEVTPDFPSWNSSVANTETLGDGNEKFLRFNVTKVDHTVLFKLSPRKIPAPGYYQITLRYRGIADSFNLHIRQQTKPYKNFWEQDVEPAREWQETTLFIHLAEKKKSAYGKEKLDKSKLVFYLSLKEGIFDFAFIKLEPSDEKAYIAAKAADIKRPEKGTENYFRNSRFPLGLPSGWNINRENMAGKVESDPDHPGPGGIAALKISSAEPITLYSAPFQTADPDQPVQVSFRYQAKGSWKVKCGGTAMTLPGTDQWRKAVLKFQPNQLERAYQMVLAGTGTFYLDSLMACTGDGSKPYRSAGECEIALAPGDSEIAATRIQFHDEAAQVKYYAFGKLVGAVLKGKVVNVYGEERPLQAVRLDSAARGSIHYDLFPKRPFGPFRIEVWAEKNGRRISPYSELVMNRVRRPLYWGKDAPNSPFGGHFFAQERVLETMKAGGMNWERLNDSCMEGTCWGWLEPERGKWVFADDTIKRYRKAKIKILGYLGSAPEWASTYHGSGHNFNYFNKMYQPRDLEAFKNYVRVVVSRYKGIIDEYQCQNEPWGKSFWHQSYDAKSGEFFQGKDPAREFVKISKTAYQEMKKVYPAAVMYGFNTMGGTKGVQWTKECLKDGAYEFCDMIDYHYYNENGQLNCFPGDPVSNAYDYAVGDIRKHVQGKMKPVVQSEANPGRGGSVPVDFQGKYPFTGLMNHSMPWKQQDNPVKWADLTCRFVIAHLKLGVKRVFLYSDHCYHYMLRPPSFPVLLGADGYPHPVLSSFSNMAWLLEDRFPVKELNVGKNVWAYLFTGRGKTVAVISGLRNGIYTARAEPNATFLDLFGNPIQSNAVYEGRIFYVISSDRPEALGRKLQSQATN